MRRYPTSGLSYSIGPGPLSPAVKILIIANAAMFVATALVPSLSLLFGLRPEAVVSTGFVWQPVTYMFLHAGVFHLLFNMLALWMFGVELERMWGTPFFVRYYAVTGVGAGLVTLAVALLPFDFAAHTYYAVTVGASGAIYGLLLAYGLYFPHRPIYLYFLFQIPARVFVMIIGAVAFLSSISAQGNGLAHAAHLGGLVIGYLYLKGKRVGRINPMAELKYRYLKWKIGRMRKRFDVYPGGRSDDRDQRVH